MVGVDLLPPGIEDYPKKKALLEFEPGSSAEQVETLTPSYLGDFLVGICVPMHEPGNQYFPKKRDKVIETFSLFPFICKN